MNKQQHSSNNAVLGAPEGMTIDECGALPVTRIRFEDNTYGWASFWKPSNKELALLATGQAVRVLVIGDMHPPLSLGVDGDEELKPIS